VSIGAVLNRGLDSKLLPSGCRSWTFGPEFGQDLENAHFGAFLNHSLDGKLLPSDWQSLIFGPDFG
jgi:hypothetical protein